MNKDLKGIVPPSSINFQVINDVTSEATVTNEFFNNIIIITAKKVGAINITVKEDLVDGQAIIINCHNSVVETGTINVAVTLNGELLTGPTTTLTFTPATTIHLYYQESSNSFVGYTS